jgi:hypothetical protein
MRERGWVWAGAVILASAWCCNSQAALVDVAGENYSWDDSTGLYWLDLTETVNLSYDAVSQGLAETSSAWRYADGVEVKHVLEESFPSFIQSVSPDGEAVTDPFYAHWQPDTNDEAQAFIDRFGSTTESLIDQYGALGVYDYDLSSKCPNSDCRGHALAGTIGRNGRTEFIVTMQGGASDQYGAPIYGHYLVATTPGPLPDFAVYPHVPGVPEPKTYAMLIVGLGLVAVLTRGDRARNT